MLHKISQNEQRAKIAAIYYKIAKLVCAVSAELKLKRMDDYNKIKIQPAIFYTILISPISNLSLLRCYIN